MSKILNSQKFAPFAYQGSKRKDLKYINNYLPNYKTFIDVCGGMGNVIIDRIKNDERKGIKFIYNDINKNLTDLFKTIANPEELNKLIKEVDSMPADKKNYDIISKKIRENKNTLSEYVYGSLYGFRSVSGHPLLNFRKGSKSIVKNPLNSERLKFFTPICQKMEILNLNLVELIEKYKEDKNCFIYIDPPYIEKGVDNSAYGHVKIDILTYISDIIKNNNYKCKIMLHIDLSGWLYDNLRDYIKFHYPKNYAMAIGKLNGVKYNQRYVAIVCNF